jgi:hypothetical protein
MELDLIDRRDMTTKKSMKKAYLTKGKLYTEDELRRFARMVIDERTKFCRDVKKENDVDKCVCEAIERWIRLFKDYPMEGSKDLGNLRVSMVKQMFEEMKKEGNTKCPEKQAVS